MRRTLFVLLIVAFGLPFAIKGAFGALLMYLWVAYFRPESWAQVAFVRSLNLSFLSGVFLLLRCMVSGERFRADFRSLLLFLFLLLSFLSTVQSTEYTAIWSYWVDFAKAIVVTYLLAVQVTDVKRFRTVLIVIGLSLGFEAAKQGWTQLLLNPGGHNDNILPQLGDNNGVAVGMLMLVAIFLALNKTAETPRERWIYRFFIVGVSYRALATYSRGGFLAAGALVVMALARSTKKLQSALAIALVAGTLLSVLPQSFWDRMSTIQVDESKIEDDSALSRLHFWRVAVNMANDHPAFGVGFNGFNRVYNQYDFLDGRFGRNRAVHSMWFGVLAELGYPALGVYILIFVSSIAAAGSVARKAKKGKLPMEFYYYGVAIQTGLVAAFVGGSFVPWQYTEMLWHFVGLGMALTSAARTAMAESAEEASSAAAGVAAAFRPLAARGMVQ